HRYIIKDGPYAGTYAEGPEYTSQGAFGTMPEINDMESVLVGNHLVNYYGLDTLETGAMITWAMELYEKGILTDEDTGGIKLEFGNKEALWEMIHKIANREGLGDILAEGPLRAAKRIGRGSEKYLVHVKGMSNLHSDERPTPSLALNVATATRGSDHLRSRPAIDLYNLPIQVLDKVYRNPIPYEGPLVNSYSSYVGKAWMVLWQEMLYMAVDCIGMCKYHTIFLGVNHPSFEEFARSIYLNAGLEFTPQQVWEVANRAYTLERMFNLREGFGREDDWLVDRYFDEPTPLGLPVARGRAIDREKFKEMLDEYYQLHEWDENGVPTPELLKKLGLEGEPSHIL
ncbi:MAG: aldehyde ferredoxin oxidoreductase, partial [Deltaproteobacteria bacterium]